MAFCQLCSNENKRVTHFYFTFVRSKIKVFLKCTSFYLTYWIRKLVLWNCFIDFFSNLKAMTFLGRLPFCSNWLFIVFLFVCLFVCFYWLFLSFQFVCHSASYVCFLMMLACASQRVERITLKVKEKKRKWKKKIQFTFSKNCYKLYFTLVSN